MLTRKLPEREDLTGRQLLGVLAQTVPDLLRSAPLLVGLMLLMAVIQGLMPAVTILLGKWTVDGVGAALAGREANLMLLAGAWAGAALLTQVTGVASQVLQGYASDHFTVRTMTRLMG